MLSAITNRSAPEDGLSICNLLAKAVHSQCSGEILAPGKCCNYEIEGRTLWNVLVNNVTPPHFTFFLHDMWRFRYRMADFPQLGCPFPPPASIISGWIALPYACRSVIDGRVGNVGMRPMIVASQFNAKSPIRALALTAKMQPTIGGVG
jgi:hypothetical protein